MPSKMSDIKMPLLKYKFPLIKVGQTMFYVVIEDRCDFDRELDRGIFTNCSEALTWGDNRSRELLQAKPEEDRHFFDPQSNITEVPFRG